MILKLDLMKKRFLPQVNKAQSNQLEVNHQQILATTTPNPKKTFPAKATTPKATPTITKNVYVEYV